jgi:hypothetical protein
MFYDVVFKKYSSIQFGIHAKYEYVSSCLYVALLHTPDSFGQQ